MLSSQDEACKFLVRSEMISYHSVNGNFFPTILPVEGLERYHSYDVSKQPFTKKLVLVRGENFGYFHVACNFGNFGHV